MPVDGGAGTVCSTGRTGMAGPRFGGPDIPVRRPSELSILHVEVEALVGALLHLGREAAGLRFPIFFRNVWVVGVFRGRLWRGPEGKVRARRGDRHLVAAYRQTRAAGGVEDVLSFLVQLGGHEDALLLVVEDDDAVRHGLALVGDLARSLPDRWAGTAPGNRQAEAY